MRPGSMRKSQRALERSSRERVVRVGALIVAGVAAGTAQAATITVNSLADATGTDGQCTLREALANANTNSDTTGGDCTAGSGVDAIDFQSGLTGTVTLGGTALLIGDSASINGPGAGTLTISGNNASRIFYVYNNAQALAVTISGLTLTQGNSAGGSAIADKGESLTLSAVTASGNTGDAVNVNAGGSLTLQSSTVTGMVNGPGIRADHFSTLNMTGSTISNNSSVSKGGGLFLYRNSGAVVIDDSTISGNTSGNRGGGFFLYNTNGPVTISNSRITGNSASSRGGGVMLYKALADVTIEDTTISGNIASNRGGGIFFYKQSAGLTFTLRRSTISGNSSGAPFSGGGIFFYKVSGSSVLENATISGNTAGASGGGGVYDSLVAGTATLAVRNSTITGNSTTGNAGNVKLTSFPSVAISNSIIANGTAAANPDLQTGAANVTVDFSLIENTTGATFTGANNLTGIDPQLGALADNGGPTLTHLPAPASPVVNAGDPGFTPPPSTDQRGLARVVGGQIDMGSVELDGGTIEFSLAAFSASEGGGNAVITITRSGGTDPAAVDYATSNGTAISPGDYTPTSGTANFAAGVTSVSFNVPIVDDLLFEGSQTFNVTLTSPSVNAALGAQSSATVTIADNDAPPALSIDNVSQNEGDSGTTAFNFTVTLTGATEETATVQYATTPGTATDPADYASTGGTLTFAPGVTTQPVTVLVNGDTTLESNETFTVDLSSPANATIAAGSGTGTIQNDDGAPTLSIDSVSQVEGDSGTTAFNFTVTLTGATEETATVQYATAPGTAGDPADYASTGGTLTFAPGVTTQPVTVLVNGDTTFESNETFTVDLSSPANATIAAGSGTGTIENDDGAVSDLSITKTATGGPFVVGQPMTFAITVLNEGPQDASAVVVTDVLPANATFESATPSQGSCSGTTTVTCSLGAIADGATATITLTVRPTIAGTFSNTAEVSNSPETDPNPANSAATALAAVDPAAVPAVPLLGDVGKMLLILTSALLGLGLLKKQSS